MNFEPIRINNFSKFGEHANHRLLVSITRNQKIRIRAMAETSGLDITDPAQEEALLNLRGETRDGDPFDKLKALAVGCGTLMALGAIGTYAGYRAGGNVRSAVVGGLAGLVGVPLVINIGAVVKYVIEGKILDYKINKQFAVKE